MSTLTWDDVSPNYHSGIQKGVFYPRDGAGVAWNGLTAVAEQLAGGEQNSYVVDGFTYLNSVGSRYYQAIVSAFSAPREFAPYVGDLEVAPGITLTKQPRRPFGFSYQTLLGDNGYRIHMVYNVTASPTSRSYQTTSDSADPTTLEWQFDAVAETNTGYRPSAHFFVDSYKTDPAVLAQLEGVLYGGVGDPAMYSVSDLIGLLAPAPVDGAGT